MILRALLLFLITNASSIVMDVKRISAGFDYGTSGARLCLIDSSKKILHEESVSWSSLHKANVESGSSWLEAMDILLNSIPTMRRKEIFRICVSGTSASALIFDLKCSEISRSARMYNFNTMLQCKQEISDLCVKYLKLYCPVNSPASASTSTLSKLLAWHLETPILPHERLVHQADFISHYLLHYKSEGKLSLSIYDPNSFVWTSDWHNSLKLGYDVRSLEYPEWIYTLFNSLNPTLFSNILPRVVEPGAVIGQINENLSKKYGIPSSCSVVGGTTDSIAAFLATGASSVGQAVTSLGSTLAIKMLSNHFVEDSNRGIYSHRLGNEWLVGGASNVGCAVLRHLNYTNEELDLLSKEIDYTKDSGYDYYPLVKTGERFPRNDPHKAPVLEPVPSSRSLYLHGILQV